MNRRILLASALLTLVAGSGACATGGPRVDRLAPTDLFARGLQAYENHKWTTAIEAFERLALEYPTHPRIQEARFDLGMAYAGRKEYLTASSEFLRLASDFPAGDYADDARYQACRMYEKLSPDVELDQQYTRTAIDHCQSLISYYPQSEYVPQAREIIAAMQNKLARKILEGGEFYYSRHAWDSAIVYFEDVLDQYPTAPAAPKALLRLVQVYQKLGYEDEMNEARQRLLKDYPNSPEAAVLKNTSSAGAG